MFPGDTRFAFTILDDTDDATTENVEPIYRLLRDLGMRTTKTAWPMDCPEGSPNYWAGATLHDVRYREFVARLVAEGFELASHGATMESSRRERTEQGLQFFRKEMSVAPTVHVNHGQNRENVYWGAERYRTWPARLVALAFERMRSAPPYEGHMSGSPYFWGDLCREQFRFVRNFTFEELDLSRMPPGRPYHLESTPYVNYWFTTADAPNVDAFNRLVTRDAVDRLVERGGFTIVSTHLGKGFVKDGVVNPRVQETLEYISTLRGWFVPVSPLLEHLLERAGANGISALALHRLEARHVFDRFRTRLRN